jgi:hypothetical protein
LICRSAVGGNGGAALDDLGGGRHRVHRRNLFCTTAHDEDRPRQDRLGGSGLASDGAGVVGRELRVERQLGGSTARNHDGIGCLHVISVPQRSTMPLGPNATRLAASAGDPDVVPDADLCLYRSAARLAQGR